MLLKELIKEGTLAISSLYPEMEAREMVFAYLSDCQGFPRHKHILEPEYAVSEASVSEARSAFARMASGEPLQYVTGRAFFYGREFRVSPSVLIPRGETEILCREVCSIPDIGCARILDLCTGSGCIAWTVALENPAADVVAVDISDEALEIASSQDFREEMSLTGADVPDFVKADVLSELKGEAFAPESFDLLLSNPPYVMDSEKALMRTNVLDYEPHLALFVPDEDPLLFYRAIAGHARTLLKPGASAMVEINEALGEATASLFREASFADVRIMKDLNDRDRFVLFRKP